MLKKMLTYVVAAVIVCAITVPALAALPEIELPNLDLSKGAITISAVKVDTFLLEYEVPVSEDLAVLASSIISPKHNEYGAVFGVHKFENARPWLYIGAFAGGIYGVGKGTGVTAGVDIGAKYSINPNFALGVNGRLPLFGAGKFDTLAPSISVGITWRP